MTKFNPKTTEQPVETVADPLTAMLRQGAKELIAQAVEAELVSMLEQHQSLRMLDGRQAVVRNGYLPERTVQTSLGDVDVKVPKVRDRSGSGICFNSTLLPPYLKRAKSIEELLPWLYLKGISTGDYQEALSGLLGDQAKGLSANTIGRLKQSWSDEHRQWSQRDLSQSRYVYWWADGVYSNVRMDDRLCLLVIIGVTEQGRKELVAMERLRKDKEELLTFYDFPAEHWLHIRTTNPIESTFATVRLRTKRASNCGSRETTLAMVYKLLETAQKRWKRIRGFNLLTPVVNNVQFKDGEQVMEQSDRNAA